MQLSKHFTLDEATFSSTAIRYGIINQPTTPQLDNMIYAAEGMELVRDLLNAPIRVNSWFRCPELNAVIGGSSRSAHMEGYAIDFTCPNFGDPLAVCREIRDSNIPFDKLIYEGSWVHISFEPTLSRSVMTAHFSAGHPTTYTKGLV